jgi:hypothetical protein
LGGETAYSTDVSTNGLSVVARLPLAPPITPVPGGGFLGASRDTNNVISKCDATGLIDPSFSAPLKNYPESGPLDAAVQSDGKS